MCINPLWAEVLPPDGTSCYKKMLTFSFSQEVMDSKAVENGEGTESQIGVATVSAVHMSSHDITQNPLRRSVSQLIDRKVGEGQDDTWDPHIRAHDSGMVRLKYIYIL